MKSKSVKAIVILALITLVFAAPARAIFGLGDVVFDPTNYAQAIRSFIQLQQQYAQLVQIYQQSRQQYEQLIWMAKRSRSTCRRATGQSLPPGPIPPPATPTEQPVAG